MNGDPQAPEDAFKYDAATGTYQTVFAGKASEAVIDFVTEISGDLPTARDPLYDTIDPEALERLVEQQTHSPQAGDLSVTFPYHGYEITVHGSGVIQAEKSREENETGESE